MSHNFHRRFSTPYTAHTPLEPRSDRSHSMDNDLYRLLNATESTCDDFGERVMHSGTLQPSISSHNMGHQYHNERVPPPPPPSFLIPPLTLNSHHQHQRYQHHSHAQQTIRHLPIQSAHHHMTHRGHHSQFRSTHQNYRSSPIQRPHRRKCDAEPHVVRECIDILGATRSNTLKSVELANAIRDRLGRDVLQMVKSAVGGLLALLEGHPSIFEVTRRPKADTVQLKPSATSCMLAVAALPDHWTDRELVAHCPCDVEEVVSVNITRGSGRRYAVIHMDHNTAALDAYFALRSVNLETSMHQDTSRDIHTMSSDFQTMNSLSPRGSGRHAGSHHVMPTQRPTMITDMMMHTARSTTSTATSDEQISPTSSGFSLFFSGGGSDWTSLSASGSSCGLGTAVPSLAASASNSSIIQRQMSDTTTSTESSPRLSMPSALVNYRFALDVLCDQQFVPHSRWPMDYERDKPILDLLVDIIATTIASPSNDSSPTAAGASLGSSNTISTDPGTMSISNLKTKLKKRLETYGNLQTSIRQPPLKALLSAYGTMFAIDDQNKSVGLQPTVAMAHYFQQRPSSSFGGL